MYFVLYDRFLRSIGETYILESWSRIQRAVDFDELKIVGEQIPYSADPFFVVVNNRQGKMMFSGLASTPAIDDKSKKTSILLKDYTTLFNTEIVVDWSQFTGSTLDEYLDFILSVWISQIDVGFSGIQWKLTDVSSIVLDKSIPLGDSKESVMLYSLVKDSLNYYNIHCEPVLDVFRKTLTFVFKRSGVNRITVRLNDFGIQTIEKSFGEYNRVNVYDSIYSLKQKWSLTKDNRVAQVLGVTIGEELSSYAGTSILSVCIDYGYVSEDTMFIFGEEEAHISELPEEEGGWYSLSCKTGGLFYRNMSKSFNAYSQGGIVTIEQDNFIYPAKNRNFIAKDSTNDALYNAVYNAVMGLAGNRYQENIDLDAQRYKSVIDLTSVDFSWIVSVYTDEGFYKDLPVGEIETDSKGKNVVRLGYRIQELTQEL